MTMSDLFIPECKETPHPAAVASGTCPAPSPEPTPGATTPAPGPSPSPSSDSTPTSAEPFTTASTGMPDHEGDQPHLPLTGLDLGWAALGVVVCVLGVVALLWGSLRER